MIFLLILHATLGPAVIGRFDDEPECQRAASAYMEMLVAHRSDEKHQAKIGCVGFPIPPPGPREESQA